MDRLIDKINDRESLMKLNTAQLNLLAQEIREIIIDITAKQGGHLASNLGAVELTIALHRVLRLPTDKLIWDVGHQSYTHKILSGRRENFKTLRSLDGECGFCDPRESRYDPYVSGHTSTSLSLALGAACARDLLGEKYNVAAVIGDGALSGGLAIEGLNNIGHTGRSMLIVLNDNEMSISENVGALNEYLTKARTNMKYVQSKKDVDSALERLPKYGQSIANVIRRTKEHVKYLVTPGVLFEELGVTYLGPIDGHDIRKMEETFRRALKLNEPVMVHVITKKGKGYSFAEKEPSKYHGVSPFNKMVGVTESSGETYSSVFGEEMCAIAREKDNVAIITPAMTLGSGLAGFEKEFPHKFYDVGIAEAHAVTFAGGLAGAGVIPVVSLYSSFAQRAYDSIIHDVAVGNMHVVFAIDRAGLVPCDGKTHQGIHDIAFFSSVPNITILSPCSFDELRKMLRYAVNECDGPVVVRYPRGNCEYKYNSGEFKPAECQYVRHGNGVTILSEGVSLPHAMKAAQYLSDKGIEADVINPRTIVPMDVDTVKESVMKTGFLVTVEQGVLRGGMGENIIAKLSEMGVAAKYVAIGLDSFVEHGSYDDILKKYALDGRSIAERIEKEMIHDKEET
ncbi:MAG: 1-deoxy-D-xylulose-5-phosphate synthase [Clostridia bacterium]